tara:strand:+ start:23760 stop:23921 length:162 start_codon:yes stop_codon:yes gene_type:complete
MIFFLFSLITIMSKKTITTQTSKGSWEDVRNQHNKKFFGKKPLGQTSLDQHTG